MSRLIWIITLGLLIMLASPVFASGLFPDPVDGMSPSAYEPNNAAEYIGFALGIVFMIWLVWAFISWILNSKNC